MLNDWQKASVAEYAALAQSGGVLKVGVRRASAGVHSVCIEWADSVRFRRMVLAVGGQLNAESLREEVREFLRSIYVIEEESY